MGDSPADHQPPTPIDLTSTDEPSVVGVKRKLDDEQDAPYCSLAGFDMFHRVEDEKVFIESPVPEKCKKGVPCCLGIDEAGRGPVLGPMVYGTAYWPVAETASIEKLGYDDSKALSEAKREEMFAGIKSENDRIGYVLCNLSAEYLSLKMLSRSKVSLNTVSHQAAVEMIRRVIDAGVNVTEIYVDTVGNAQWYQDYLTKLFGDRATVVVKPKADSLYKVVSAASICAKVTRDVMVRDWVYREGGVEVEKFEGSGYPSDERTKKWLQANTNRVFGFPHFVRFSWQTTKTILDDPQNMNVATVEWEDEEEPGSQPITQFFVTKKEDKRAPYFQKLGLKPASKLLTA